VGQALSTDLRRARVHCVQDEEDAGGLRTRVYSMPAYDESRTPSDGAPVLVRHSDRYGVRCRCSAALAVPQNSSSRAGGRVPGCLHGEILTNRLSAQYLKELQCQPSPALKSADGSYLICLTPPTMRGTHLHA
jgi:hypothetical protein